MKTMENQVFQKTSFAKLLLGVVLGLARLRAYKTKVKMGRRFWMIIGEKCNY